MISFFFLFIIVQLQLTTGCVKSDKCVCEVDVDGKITIRCDHKELNTFPDLMLKNPDTNVKKIILTDNNIESIPADSFKSHDGIKTIDLSRNPIKYIDENAFSTIQESLTELLMSKLKNEKFSLESIPFSKLSKLEKLIVSKFSTNHIQGNLFSNLKSLKTLELTHGFIIQIDSVAFDSFKGSLQFLDLSNNAIQQMPAIEDFSHLETLIFSSNDHNQLPLVFEPSNSLKILKIDHSKGQIENNIFQNLDFLETIDFSLSKWKDRTVASIITLKNLNKIDASFNGITDISIFSNKNFPNLKILNLENNRIDTIDTKSKNLISESLRELNLAKNPLSHLHPDSFHRLPFLQTLTLENTETLNFNGNTFKNQKNLKKLLISSSNLTGFEWETISELTSLNYLKLSNCQLSNIPDLTFQKLSHLENLYLDQNKISTLTQLTFYGLENTLQKLSLSSNSLTKIDKCSIGTLKNLDILDLKLDNNPLECECDMKWLFDKLNILRRDRKKLALISTLRWKCYAQDLLFKDLKQSHFSPCQNVSKPCESIMTTRPPHHTTTNAFITVSVTDVTHNSFLINVEPKVENYKEINLQVTESPNRENKIRNVTFSNNQKQHQISDLKSSTEYTIIIEIFFKGEIPSFRLEKSVTTLRNIIPIIIASTVGALLILLSLSMVIYICVRNRKRQKGPIVEMTNNSRRFVKSTNSLKSSNPYNYRDPYSERPKTVEPMYSDHIIQTTLKKMTEEEKSNLVNLLTKSTEGLNDKDPKYSRFYKEYDEIPGDYYEEIKEPNTFSLK